MADIIGPILVIVLIYGLYYAATNIDMLGDTKKAKLEIEKIDAEVKREEIAVRKRELEVEMGRLAIKARELDMLEFNPNGATEADFRVVEELEDKRKKK